MKTFLLLLSFALSFLVNPALPTSNAALGTHIEPKSPTVYITRTGLKYHREKCKSLRKSKIAIRKKDAISKGYGACSLCHP